MQLTDMKLEAKKIAAEWMKNGYTVEDGLLTAQMIWYNIFERGMMDAMQYSIETVKTKEESKDGGSGKTAEEEIR